MANIQSGKNINGGMYQNCTIIESPSDIAEITKLISNKNYSEAVAIINTRMHQFGATHPMYPDFAVDFKKTSDKLVLCSKPMNKEAAEKYPPHLSITFKLNKKYKDFESIEEVWDYAYASQQDIDINVIDSNFAC